MGEGVSVLSFEITDTEGRKTGFSKPLMLSIVSSEDAAADSLSAVFGVSGKIPVLKDIRVSLCGETLFYGFVDEQAESLSPGGKTLEIRARSIEAVLLDNEARPQQYFMPSMPLLMKRHFEPLGFTQFVGTAQPFNGELSISKGESEWEVLCSFSEKFLRIKPKLLPDGVIDISGSYDSSTVFIGRKDILSEKKIIRRSKVISDIYERTYAGGGYEMHTENELAAALGVKRTRYVNTFGGKNRSILLTERLIPDSNAAAYRYELTVSGSIMCRVGDLLYVEGSTACARITEVHHTYSESGEKTRIFAEVTDDVDRQESGK